MEPLKKLETNKFQPLNFANQRVLKLFFNLYNFVFIFWYLYFTNRPIFATHKQVSYWLCAVQCEHNLWSNSNKFLKKLERTFHVFVSIGLSWQYNTFVSMQIIQMVTAFWKTAMKFYTNKIRSILHSKFCRMLWQISKTIF